MTPRRSPPRGGEPSSCSMMAGSSACGTGRNFREQYVQSRWNVEDWNEGDEQSCLLNRVPEASVQQVTEEEG